MPSFESWKKMTSARIGLSRSGGSLSTKDLLQFRLDHARAKDAVLLEPKFGELLIELDHIGKKYGIEAVPAESRAKDRGEYLLRPDLGRSLSEPSHGELLGRKGSYDLDLVCVDGLSAKAIDSNLLPFLESLLPKLKDYKLGPLVLTRLGRVAIGDEIGQCLGAKAVVVIIGERPGLSSADSLGVYLTYEPTIGKTDERRNCVSNIRPGGLEFEAASVKTRYLLEEALKRRLSGVELKDEMDPSFFVQGGTKQLD